MKCPQLGMTTVRDPALLRQLSLDAATYFLVSSRTSFLLSSTLGNDLAVESGQDEKDAGIQRRRFLAVLVVVLDLFRA